MALNDRQERFCRELVIDNNASAAYRRAGYNPKNEAVSRANASRMLTYDNVKARVAELRMEQEKRLEVTADWVVQGLAAEATRFGEGTSHAARVSAYKTLAQIKGMIVGKQEITGKDGGPIEWIEVGGEVGADEPVIVSPAPPAGHEAR